MPDAFFYTIEKVGIYGGIAVLSTMLLFYVIYKVTIAKINTLCSVTYRLNETISMIQKAIVTRDGEVVCLEEHQRLLDSILQRILDIEGSTLELFKQHIADVERACNEERYISCDINRCKHFSQIITLVEQMREYLRIFVAEGRDARNNTTDSIQSVNAKFDMFLVEVLRALQDERKKLS